MRISSLVRRYIHDELLYRYITVQDGKEASTIEAVSSRVLGVEGGRS
jgi:hypothetical protein